MLNKVLDTIYHDENAFVYECSHYIFIICFKLRWGLLHHPYVSTSAYHAIEATHMVYQLSCYGARLYFLLNKRKLRS